MFKPALAVASVLLLAACDQDFGSSEEVVIEGRAFTVAPGRRYAGQWYASPADRSVFFGAPAGIRSGNVRAIEAVTGCAVIPETVDHVDAISTIAEVRC